MISNRELKDEIEQLNEQNQSLTDELQQIKQLLQSQQRSQPQQQSQQQQDKQEAAGSDKKDRRGGDVSGLASDFKKLKDMTNQLENKMQSYIENNKSGDKLTQEDVVNLMLYMMNGMIDWTMDMMSGKQSNQSNNDSDQQAMLQ